MKTIYNDKYIALISLFSGRRKTLNLSQQEVAQRLGWSRHMLSRVENRDRRLDIIEAVQLGRTLGVSLRGIEKVLGG